MPVDDKCEDPRTGPRPFVLPEQGGGGRTVRRPEGGRGAGGVAKGGGGGAKPGSGGAALAKGVL